MTTEAPWYGGECEQCGCGMWKESRKQPTKPVDAPDRFRRRQRDGICNTCYMRVRRGSQRTRPLSLQEDDFIEEYTFLRGQQMSDREIARALGMELSSLRNRLGRVGIIAYDTEEQNVWNWITSYCNRGISFTVDSLPFTDDTGIHQRLLNDAIRAGLLRRTDTLRESALNFHGAPPRHVYEPVTQ